jgi:hypothetical protein
MFLNLLGEIKKLNFFIAGKQSDQVQVKFLFYNLFLLYKDSVQSVNQKK